MPRVIGALNPRQEAMLFAIAEFIGAESIEYHDLGNGEDYILNKNGKQLILQARGNRIDGGFLLAVLRSQHKSL